MIRLKTESYCQNCPHFDPECDSITRPNGDVETDVFCADRDRCKALVERVNNDKCPYYKKDKVKKK